MRNTVEWGVAYGWVREPITNNESSFFPSPPTPTPRQTDRPLLWRGEEWGEIRAFRILKDDKNEAVAGPVE